MRLITFHLRMYVCAAQQFLGLTIYLYLPIQLRNFISTIMVIVIVIVIYSHSVDLYRITKSIGIWK